MPSDRGTKRAFFDITIGEEPAGRIVFSLWDKACPKTVENFRALCTGEKGIMDRRDEVASYHKSIFHRVIKGFMIQGGDFTNGDGTGGYSIYQKNFLDENLALKHKKPFLLSMANKGPDTNGSQFFITCRETPHLDGKHVVFGEVIKGFDVVERIENLEVGDNDKPLLKVQIARCGEMVRKGSEAAEAAALAAAAQQKADPFEPKTRNWLMRASKSPEGREKNLKKKGKRDTSRDRRHRRDKSRSRSNDRSRRHRRSSRSRSRSRSGRRDRSRSRESRRKPEVSKDQVKVRGRGKLTFLGGGSTMRSTTPPHWRKEEAKKVTLEEAQKRAEQMEERKKEMVIRAKEESERRLKLEQERQEREANRELERQERKKRHEEKRQKEAAPRRFTEAAPKTEVDSDPEVEPRIKLEVDDSSSSSESSRSSSDSSDSDSS